MSGSGFGGKGRQNSLRDSRLDFCPASCILAPWRLADHIFPFQSPKLRVALSQSGDPEDLGQVAVLFWAGAIGVIRISVA